MKIGLFYLPLGTETFSSYKHEAVSRGAAVLLPIRNCFFPVMLEKVYRQPSPTDVHLSYAEACLLSVAFYTFLCLL